MSNENSQLNNYNIPKGWRKTKEKFKIKMQNSQPQSKIQNCRFKIIGKNYFKQPISSLESFIELQKNTCCKLEVFWQKKPSPEKLLKVNITIRFLMLLSRYYKAKIYVKDGIIFSHFKRKLWDKYDKYIVGYGMKPLVIIKVGGLFYRVFFNGSIFVDVESTSNEFFPFATIIVMKISDSIVWRRTPLSRDGDLITCDFYLNEGLFIESLVGYLNKKNRKYFKGWKYITTSNKYLISTYKLSLKDRTLIQNNGFTIYEQILSGLELDKVLLKIINNYFNFK